ncbi:MAG: hypothetical protein IKY13_07615 [Bacteroidaceae bacterium]|nr:hypothetical protein [Bacteroidaceae bacterium]
MPSGIIINFSSFIGFPPNFKEIAYWTPISYQANTFAGTFDGNGYTISNLKYSSTEDDWYVGLFGGSKNATFKNLTLTNVEINCEKGLHFAALVGDAAGKTVIENVTVNGDVVIRGDINNTEVGRIGVIVGGNSGNYTIKDVTIDVNEGSYVEGNSSIGGVAGQLQGTVAFENVKSNIDVRAARFFAGGIIGLAPEKATFKDCSTSGNVTLTAATGANSPYRLGAIVGGWDDNTNNTLTLKDCAYTGTLESNVIVGFDCAGFVGRGYSAVVGAKVSVNGTVYEYVGNGVYVVAGVTTYMVSTADELQVALTNANGATQINFVQDIEGNVTVDQKEGVNIVIDGCNKKYDGTITLDGNSRSDADETLVIKNVNFETSTASLIFIDANSADNTVRYAHNVTIDNCTFTAAGAAENTAVAMKYRQTFDMAVVKTTATGLHSLMQLYGCDGITVDGAVVEGKNGISFGTAKNHIVKNTTINAEGYGLRCDGNDGVKELVVSNCEIEANDPIVVRNMTIAEASYTVKFEGTNTLTASNTEGYQVVFTKGDDGTYEMPIGAYAITGADGLKIYPAAAETVVIAGATASESANALANAIANTDASEITLASAVEYVGEAFNVTRDVVFNMAGMELNAGSTASSKNYALELYGDIDVEINDANFTRAGITADQGANLVFKSGIINHKPERSSRYIFCAWGDDTQITIENGTFNNDRPNNSYFWVDGNAVIYVKGGTFAGVASTNKIITTNGGRVIISGGTFNFDPTAWLAAGYKAEKSGSNWTVVAE